jgi:hypothetical protein
MKKTTYAQLLERIDGLDAWLNSLGVQPSADDRIHRHIRNVRQLSGAFESGQVNEHLNALGAQKRREIIWSLVELAELGDTYEAFRSDPPAGLAGRLRAVLHGKTDPAAEDIGKSKARAFMFELNLASQFKRAGLDVDFPREPDVLCRIEGYSIHFQCKRPFHENSISANIKRAAKQLRRTLDQANDRRVFGITAISLSKVLNSGDSLLVAEDHALDDALGDHLEQLGQKYPLRDRVNDTRVIGKLLHVITPAVIRGVLSSAEQVVVMHVPGRDGRELLELMHRHLLQNAGESMPERLPASETVVGP